MFSAIKNFFQDVNAFYPEYLKAHNKFVNLALHFIGSTIFWTLIILFFIHFTWWYLPLAIFAGYFFPAIGHKFFQHNESFRTSQPVLCVICAFQLYIDILTFQIEKKMRRARAL